MTNRIPTHPGDVLKEELEARNISQREFANLTGINYTMLNEVLNGKRSVTGEFALMMEASLGINPDMLINMQNRYTLAMIRQRSPFILRLNEIHRKCAAVLL